MKTHKIKTTQRIKEIFLYYMLKKSKSDFYQDNDTNIQLHLPSEINNRQPKTAIQKKLPCLY